MSGEPKEYKLLRLFLGKEILTGVDGGLRRAVQRLWDDKIVLQAQASKVVAPARVLHGTATIQDDDLASIDMRRECRGAEATLIIWEEEDDK